MSSPQMNTSAYVVLSNYSTMDTTNRHDCGVQKNKKQASTGGGRAWSENEEVYLLQSRLQKKPYKHIAAHLKKTELACRLHYHQLSHGGNRRKRTDSDPLSSTGSAAGSATGSAVQSPVMSHSMPSPISESMQPATPSSYSYSPQSPAQIQLPSAATLLNRAGSYSPPPKALNYPVAILPKPSPVRRALSNPVTHSPTRLECNEASGQVNFSNVDQDRLRQVYEAHRASFWSAIASEYGTGASPILLEEVWKRGITTIGPPTPCSSPKIQTARSDANQAFSPKPVYHFPTPLRETKNSATSISALLGIDASPRSPKERELIKRMEEQRDTRDFVMGDMVQRYE